MFLQSASQADLQFTANRPAIYRLSMTRRKARHSRVSHLKSGTSEIPLTGVCYVYPATTTMGSTMNGIYLRRAAFAAGLVLWQLCALAADTQSTRPSAMVKQLVDKELGGVPGKELVMLTVESDRGPR